MLLEFKTKNFKLFKDELVFSMVPAPKQKGLDYSVFQKKIGSRKYKGLCSAVIYGPNASGKTNIINAMDVFKSIVLRGTIRNDNNKNTPNAAAYRLELIPNSTAKEIEPVSFSIKFIENDLLIEYKFSIDIGGFLDADYSRNILFEELNINEEMAFSRKDSLQLGDFQTINNYLINEFWENADGATALAKRNLNNEELFLTSGFKTMFSAKLVNIITNWLDNKFVTICRADSLKLQPKRQTMDVKETTDEGMQFFGVKSNGLGYVFSEDESEADLVSVFNNLKKAIPAEIYESYGTIRFVNIFPLVIRAIRNGETLVIDEFDASIHPMAIMNIINIFHNDDINKKNAQLIFDTHNPIFLNSNLFRRDEIKFVERDDETHFSKHYSLSDFKTTGDNSVRKGQDYMHKYFISQYGAIKDIDFTPIFEILIERSEA